MSDLGSYYEIRSAPKVAWSASWWINVLRDVSGALAF